MIKTMDVQGKKRQVSQGAGEGQFESKEEKVTINKEFLHSNSDFSTEPKKLFL